MTATPSKLPQVNVSEHGKVRYLHLGTAWVQGSMWLKKPNDIELEYVQRMQAWLLFHEADDVGDLHAMQFGLGAATLTKHCYRVLDMRTTAIELNPQVVAACRTWFELPPDDERLNVVLGDAAEVAAHEHWQGQVDVLHVDLYDDEAAAPVLDDPVFSGHCKNGADAMGAINPTREGTTVVLAQRAVSRPAEDSLQARAAQIQARWRLPVPQWLRHFKPIAA